MKSVLPVKTYRDMGAPSLTPAVYINNYVPVLCIGTVLEGLAHWLIVGEIFNLKVSVL